MIVAFFSRERTSTLSIHKIQCLSDESDKLSSTSRTAFRIKSATKRMLGLSIKDSRSYRSTSRSRPVSAVSSVSTAGDLQPALTPSLFAHVPPTLNFVQEGEKGSYILL